MPILNVENAARSIVIKRSMNSGFAGIENELYFGRTPRCCSATRSPPSPTSPRSFRTSDAGQQHDTTKQEASNARKSERGVAGELRTGSGTFTAGDSIPASSRFDSRFEDGPGANPEQLIAAALASCFSMALSNALAAGRQPGRVRRTDALATIRRSTAHRRSRDRAEHRRCGARHRPGDLRAVREKAKTGCIVSRALAGVPEITLEATLAG